MYLNLVFIKMPPVLAIKSITFGNFVSISSDQEVGLTPSIIHSRILNFIVISTTTVNFSIFKVVYSHYSFLFVLCLSYSFASVFMWMFFDSSLNPPPYVHPLIQKKAETKRKSLHLCFCVCEVAVCRYVPLTAS